MGLNFVSALLTSVRGFNISHIALDVMHIIDLGVSQHLCGLIMRRLVVGNFVRSTKRLAKSRLVDNMVHLRRFRWNKRGLYLDLLAVRVVFRTLLWQRLMEPLGYFSVWQEICAPSQQTQNDFIVLTLHQAITGVL